MAITTYSDLVRVVGSFLDRDDFDAVEIPDAITLVDSKLKRDLRKVNTREAFTINSLVEALPAGASEVRYLSLNTSTGAYNKPLEQVSPAALADSAARFQSSGRPTKFSVVDGNIIFNRTPDDTYDATISYFNEHTALDAGDSSTWTLLAEEPDLYLEGVLTQMFTFLQHDERVAEHRAEFERIIEKINRKRERTEFGAAPQPIRLPVVFGE
jgi:hypothetical protein